MKTKHVKLTVDLCLKTDTKGNENWLDEIGSDIIREYLSIRHEEQNRDVEDFEAQNGFIIEEYHVENVKEDKAMKTINLTEQEIGIVLQAVSIRLNGILGYGLSEEDYLNSAKEKLEKYLND